MHVLIDLLKQERKIFKAVSVNMRTDYGPIGMYTFFAEDPVRKCHTISSIHAPTPIGRGTSVFLMMSYYALRTLDEGCHFDFEYTYQGRPSAKGRIVKKDGLIFPYDMISKSKLQVTKPMANEQDVVDRFRHLVTTCRRQQEAMATHPKINPVLNLPIGYFDPTPRVYKIRSVRKAGGKHLTQIRVYDNPDLMLELKGLPESYPYRPGDVVFLSSQGLEKLVYHPM